MLRLVLLAALLAGAAAAQPADFGDYVPPDAVLETLATGFTWSEGPVWRPAERDLLFSDVPKNTVYRWSEADGLSVFLRPSGLAFDDGHEGDTGSNGLALVADGLLLADHGNRVVARLDPRTFVRETLASRYDGRRLNSPNDLAVHASGAVYFTDPPSEATGHTTRRDGLRASVCHRLAIGATRYSPAIVSV